MEKSMSEFAAEAQNNLLLSLALVFLIFFNCHFEKNATSIVEDVANQTGIYN
jgi:hypothetical protein